MYVCMYVYIYIYVCEYIYMYVHADKFMYVLMLACIYVCMHVFMSACMPYTFICCLLPPRISTIHYHYLIYMIYCVSGISWYPSIIYSL